MVTSLKNVLHMPQTNSECYAHLPVPGRTANSWGGRTCEFDPIQFTYEHIMTTETANIPTNQ
jgi:hypothetical protein